MRQFTLSSEANADLLEIWVYIAERSIESADRMVDSIREKCQLLADSPAMGRKRAELAEGLRSFPVGHYVIYYRQTDDGILVVRVLHGARDVDALFATEEADT